MNSTHRTREGSVALFDGHALVYAHFAQTDRVPEHVCLTLRRFSDLAEQLILVVAGRESIILPKDLEDRLEVICRPNQGWDFASYRAGISTLELKRLSRLTLCNDSVFGPLFPLAPIYESMRNQTANVWGLTASDELQWHLQSYFLVFDTPAMTSPAFHIFWEQLPVFSDRRSAIRGGEIELSKQLQAAGLKLSSYCLAKADRLELPASQKLRRASLALRNRWLDRQFYLDVLSWLGGTTSIGVNPAMDLWFSLVRDEQLPFVKRKALVQAAGLEDFRRLVADGDSGADEDFVRLILETVGQPESLTKR